jgi:hypothetical protein
MYQYIDDLLGVFDLFVYRLAAIIRIAQEQAKQE